MRKVLFATALFVLAVPAALAQLTDTHVVTVMVNGIDWVDVDNTQVDLIITINAATGVGQDTAVSSLNYGTNQANRKITVQTDLAVINFPLYVQASGVAIANFGAAPGAAGAEVTITTAAADLITGISASDANCTLTYRAEADVSDTPATETHNVTYTITT